MVWHFFFILSKNKFYIWIRDVHECFGKGESVIFKYQERPFLACPYKKMREN